MKYPPDKFEVAHVFFGLCGSNKLYFKGDRLHFHYKPDSWSKYEPRNLEIAPLEDEWIQFWNKMDEIGAWDWEEEYVPPKDVFMDGNMTDINLSYNGRKIKSFCWCFGPTMLGEF